MKAVHHCLFCILKLSPLIKLFIWCCMVVATSPLAGSQRVPPTGFSCPCVFPSRLCPLGSSLVPSPLSDHLLWEKPVTYCEQPYGGQPSDDWNSGNRLQSHWKLWATTTQPSHSLIPNPLTCLLFDDCISFARWQLSKAC